MEQITETLVALDSHMQVRIGGKSDRNILDEIGVKQYNLGKYSAYKTDIRSGGTLVGDYFQA